MQLWGLLGFMVIVGAGLIWFARIVGDARENKSNAKVVEENKRANIARANADHDELRDKHTRR